jgi:hypothetical protein
MNTPATPVAPVLSPSIEIAFPGSFFAEITAKLRRAVQPRRTETLEAVLRRSIEDAFRQFGRELGG